MPNSGNQIKTPVSLTLVRSMLIIAVAMTILFSSTRRLNAQAWEYRAYQVAVWVCTDGSPDLEANREQFSSEIMRRSRLIDASAWNLDVTSPSLPVQWSMLESVVEPADLTQELATNPELAEYDKLMLVCLSRVNGELVSRVRELDMDTQQWGPLGTRVYATLDGVSSGLTLQVKNAFMPIAEVQRVTTEDMGEGKRPADMVYLRSRAIRTCKRVRPWMNTKEIPGDGEDNDENGLIDDVSGWAVEDIVTSPVWVKATDRFLPIIRRTNKQGELTKLEPIEFTYLTIERQEYAKSVCAIQSTRNAPLHGRKSKRLRKLALVIRPPESSTFLKLVGRDEAQTPLEGYTVISGHPGAKLEDLEDLGTTDWRGIIEIPPSKRGMRLLLIKHGDRRLMKIPMIPGMYPEQVTAVPDDENRLFAEGIISGLSTEILNLVAQRNVYENEISDALDQGRTAEARELLDKYIELPRPADIKNRLADERTSLKIRSTERREQEFIDTMFDTLLEVLSSKAVESKETEILRRIQDPNYIPAERTGEDARDDSELQNFSEPGPMTRQEARAAEAAKARAERDAAAEQEGSGNAPQTPPPSDTSGIQ